MCLYYPIATPRTSSTRFFFFGSSNIRTSIFKSRHIHIKTSMGLTVFLPLTNLQKSSKMKNLRRNNKKTKTFQFLTN